MHRDSASLLATGDIQGLLDLHRSRFGSTRMEGEGGDGGAGAEGGTGGDGAQGSQSFTQADVDRIVTERLNRQKAQFKEFDTYKASHDELQQLKTANQTDMQKLQAERDAERERATAAAQETATLRHGLAKAQIKAIATGEFIDPDIPFAFLDPAKYVKDDGSVDSETIEVDLKELLKQRPTLGLHSNTDVGFGARNAGGTAPGMNDLLRQSAGRR